MSSGQQHLTKASSIGSLAHTTKEEDTAAQNSYLPRHVISEQKKYSSGSLIPESTYSPKRISMEADRFASSKLILTCVIDFEAHIIEW